MAYATTNPPILMSQAPCGNGRNWYYSDEDAIGTIDGTGYFTNGQDLGMQVGDFVTVFSSSTGTPKSTLTHVSAVSSTGATVVITSS